MGSFYPSLSVGLDSFLKAFARESEGDQRSVHRHSGPVNKAPSINIVTFLIYICNSGIEQKSNVYLFMMFTWQAMYCFCSILHIEKRTISVMTIH